jgi:hypothetical protein
MQCAEKLQADFVTIVEADMKRFASVFDTCLPTMLMFLTALIGPQRLRRYEGLARYSIGGFKFCHKTL